jgi:hypothetical protein
MHYAPTTSGGGDASPLRGESGGDGGPGRETCRCPGKIGHFSFAKSRTFLIYVDRAQKAA